MTGPVVVVAAVVERDGRFLVTRRPRGTHLEGCWEFPGGKCHPDETREQALKREILEELGADITDLREIFEVTHPYQDRTVELHFFRCSLASEPRPLLGQEARWVARAALATLQFPPADAELIAGFLLS
jgi:8-oxo-dGTP diphosphatase